MTITPLYLTAPQLREALARLEHVHVPQRTLADWLARGWIAASLRWQHAEPKSGHAARGAGRNACVFSLADLAYARLFVRLRSTGMPITDVLTTLAFLREELADVLRPKTDAVLRQDGRRWMVERPSGSVPLPPPDGQYALPLIEVTNGNEETMRALTRRTAGR